MSFRLRFFALAAALIASAGAAAADDLKIALIYGRPGRCRPTPSRPRPA